MWIFRARGHFAFLHFCIFVFLHLCILHFCISAFCISALNGKDLMSSRAKNARPSNLLSHNARGAARHQFVHFRDFDASIHLHLRLCLRLRSVASDFAAKASSTPRKRTWFSVLSTHRAKNPIPIRAPPSTSSIPRNGDLSGTLGLIGQRRSVSEAHPAAKRHDGIC